jgi:flavin-dependent dehydrogenase
MRSEIPEAADIVVLGGGPAASAAARLLALWGHEVVMLPGGARRRMSAAESLPPSCRKPLGLLGMLEAVEEAGFLETRGNTSAWESEELRTLDFGAPGGFQVERERFDAVLRGTVSAAGATVASGARAEGVRLVEGGSGALVAWRTRAANGTIRARWVLDGSGRAGIVARQGFRVAHAGPATVSIVAVWSRDGAWELPDESHTLVEAYSDGWAWSVPIGGGRRYVAVMVDPRASGLDRGSGLEQMYRRELARTRHFCAFLSGAEAGPPSACVATPYSAVRYGGPGFLLAGDAGSFIDPLSSFGVKKALASGWLAAVVANTSLEAPAMTGAALSLFEERERLAESVYRSLAARYYAAGAERFGTPFWTSRAAARGGAEAAPTEGAPGGEPRRDLAWEGLAEAAGGMLPLERGDSRVREALDRLRSAPVLRLAASADVRREKRPLVRGRSVVLEEHLVAPSLPGGIRYHRGVELPLLMELAPVHDQVPSLYEGYLRAAAPVALPEFLGALSGLLALGLLEAEPEAP